MLAPANRLILVVAGLLLPLATAAGLWPAATALCIFLGTFISVLVAADAAMGLWRAGRGLRFEVPPLVRLTKGRPGVLPIVVRNDLPGVPRRAFRLGIDLPPSIGSVEDERTIWLENGAERSRLPWACVAGQRGRFDCGRVYYRTDTTLGLWTVRRRVAFVPGPPEIRVYPDLRAEQRQSSAFLRRRGLGVHAMRQVGRGRDFEKLRDYVAGDSIEDISWKATARRGRPVSKVFQVERTQEVYVVIDGSRLSSRLAMSATPVTPPKGDPSAATAVLVPPTVMERYVASTLMLCLAAERQGDLFGLAAFSDHVLEFRRAKNGSAHFNSCREAIYALEPAVVSPDYEELGSFLRLRLRRRALLLILTSLDDPGLAESFARAAEGLSRQHLVLVNMLRPDGAVPLFQDADAGASVRSNDDVYRRLAGHLQWQHLRETANRLQRHGVHFSLLDPARMTEQLVAQYTRIKQRQIL